MPRPQGVRASWITGRRPPASLRLAPWLALVALLGACGSEPAPPTGQVLYRRHCAACHGLDGRGDGPLADSLDVRPADLTTLARRNDGDFDDAEVMAVIDGRRAVAQHGPREMPVWGAVFAEKLQGEPWAAHTNLLHSRTLVDYLRSIQEP